MNNILFEQPNQIMPFYKMAQRAYSNALLYTSKQYLNLKRTKCMSLISKGVYIHHLK